LYNTTLIEEFEDDGSRTADAQDEFAAVVDNAVSDDIDSPDQDEADDSDDDA
jgi:hypothetical protein